VGEGKSQSDNITGKKSWLSQIGKANWGKDSPDRKTKNTTVARKNERFSGAPGGERVRQAGGAKGYIESSVNYTVATRTSSRR